MLLYSVLAGVLFGLYFSLIGLGLNLVFGVMRIVNLAHGDFLMVAPSWRSGCSRCSPSIPYPSFRSPSRHSWPSGCRSTTSLFRGS